MAGDNMKNRFITIIVLIVLILNISQISMASTSACTDGNKYIILIDLYARTLTLVDKKTQEEVKVYPIAIGKNLLHHQ